jgi:Methyltransferase domain
MILMRVARGLLTYVPAIEKRIGKATSGTDSARYCYSVWLRHLAMARASQLPDDPRVVAELGPGDSLGIGVMALLTGASQYVGLDVVAYADASRNLALLDELVRLLQSRAAIPDPTEFPELKPYLPSYEFPSAVLTEERLSRCLAATRAAAIRRALQNVGEAIRTESGEEIRIVYRVPWFDPAVIQRGTIDMVYSQAVLEHVDDLKTTYAALAAWLKPGGVASHQIGFVSHRITPEWNGHWTIADPVWKLIRGRRPYLLNREPASTHVRMLRESGLEIVKEERVHKPSDVSRARLAARFRSMSEDDLTTKAVFLQAIKR